MVGCDVSSCVLEVMATIKAKRKLVITRLLAADAVDLELAGKEVDPTARARLIDTVYLASMRQWWLARCVPEWGSVTK